MSLVCDTSGLLAALDTADPEHEACATVLRTHPGPFLVGPLVLAELDHLVRSRLGAAAARALAEDVADGAYELAELRSTDLRACVGLDRAYADLGIGLADASCAVLAARAGSRTVLTLDHRHFRAVRPLQGGAFVVLPADA